MNDIATGSEGQWWTGCSAIHHSSFAKRQHPNSTGGVGEVEGALADGDAGGRDARLGEVNQAFVVVQTFVTGIVCHHQFVPRVVNLGQQIDGLFDALARHHPGIVLRHRLGGWLCLRASAFENRIKRVIKVLGMVNSTEEFTKHPYVINGCSEVFAEVFGE